MQTNDRRGEFKKVINKDESRRKREELSLNLRKSKRDDHLRKKEKYHREK